MDELKAPLEKKRNPYLFGNRSDTIPTHRDKTMLRLHTIYEVFLFTLIAPGFIYVILESRITG
jgi:hypothetical protein